MKVSALSWQVAKEHDLVVQPLDILLDGINELGLVLLDGSTNLWDRQKTTRTSQISVSYLWANKQSVELGEHPEKSHWHFSPSPVDP